MQRKISERVIGHWPVILEAAGVSKSALTGKHVPCPVCGGRDRFRFDDQEGRGSWICSKCGAGGGFDLLMKVKGYVGFADAARFVETVIGKDAKPIQPKPTENDNSAAEVHAAVQTLWREAKPISRGDPADTYLRARLGDYQPSRALRFHSAAKRSENSDKTYPCLLAAYVDVHGDLFGLQRTYLTPEGRKIDWGVARLTMGKLPEGGAVRLSRPDKIIIGLAEGVETAMSASTMFNIPVWAALNEGRMRVWQPPEGVTEIVIFADNDVNFVGQWAAYDLAARLRRDDRFQVQVMVPGTPDTDWNDEHRLAMKGSQGQ